MYIGKQFSLHQYSWRLDMSAQFMMIIIMMMASSNHLQLLFVSACHRWIHLNLRWRESGHGNELQVWITGEFACQPQERLLKVVVAFSTDVVVLHNIRPQSH